jgi:hypothetical protein
MAALGEVVAHRAVDRELGPVLSALYRTGHGGRLRTAAERLSLAGAGLLVVTGGRRVPPRWRVAGGVAGGVMVAAGAAVDRFAVAEAGRASAEDPRYVVELQQ